MNYSNPREFKTLLAGQSIRYFSKPGIPFWDQVPPSNTLLAANVVLAPQDQVLLLGCGHGALAVSLASKIRTGRIWLLDSSLIALQLSSQTLLANGVENSQMVLGTSLLPEGSETIDVVVMDLPKGRKLARRWLAEAWHALRPGGKLYLAGANELGIQSVLKDAEGLFGQGSILAYKKGNRVGRFFKTTSRAVEPEWLREPGIAPGSWNEFEILVKGERLRLRSLAGVFSTGELDDGTRLLVDHIPLTPGIRVLDLGCGYGLIGLLAARAGAEHVDLVDSSLLAVAAAQENLDFHGIRNARAFPSDALNSVLDQRYQLVISNPPFHVGKAVETEVTQAFIRQSWQVLDPGGKLVLVANKFIRYEQYLDRLFTDHERSAETGKYYVLTGTK